MLGHSVLPSVLLDIRGASSSARSMKTTRTVPGICSSALGKCVYSCCMTLQCVFYLDMAITFPLHDMLQYHKCMLSKAIYGRIQDIS